MTTKCSTGTCARVAVVIQHHLTVDDYVLDADVVLKRFGVGRFIENSIGGKDRDVGKRSGLQSSAILQSELGRVERRHLANGILKRQQLQLADVSASARRLRPRVETADA